MSNTCTLCNDNFIVNIKSIKCSSCRLDFHTKCVQIKDSVLKALSESRNICFFCDNCLESVKAKLEHKPDMHSIRNDMESLDALVEKHSKAIMEDSYKKFNILKDEIVALKDSNKDLVRLMSSDEFKNTGTSRSGDIIIAENESSAKLPSIPSNMKQKTSSKKTFHQSGLQKETKILAHTKEAKEHPKPSSYLGKPLTRDPAVRGKGKPDVNIKPAPKGRKWIWIGGLSRETSALNILSYAKERWPDSDLLCFDLKSKSSKKSFEVGSINLELEELLNPEAWPENILFRPFQSI